MQQRELGAGGPRVGAIGLGCMSFSGVYGETDLATCHNTLAFAREQGVTHLDTANIYGMGRSEEMIGAFLGGNNHGFEIASKAGISFAKDSRGFDNSETHLRRELEQSLKRLGVDHIALYYIHRRDQTIPIEDVMGTMLALRDEGKIGSIGFSEISPSSLRRASSVGPVAAVQSEYSLWTRIPELGMIQTCAEVGAAFVPFSPVARGMFGATSPDRSKFLESDIRRKGPRFQDPNWDYNQPFFETFRAFATELGISSVGLAIAWVLDQGSHLIPIPGTRTVDHLKELIEGASFDMTDETRGQIEQIMPVGFAHGDRYSDRQLTGVERYC